MNIYIVIYLIILILGLFADSLGTLRAKKVYVTVCILMFLLLNSLKSLTVGADTENYYHMFLYMKDLSWNEIGHEFIGRYYLGTSEEDIGYVLFVRGLSLFTQDFHVFTFVAESLFFVPLGIFLYKYSKNCSQLIFAFVLYGTLLNAIPITNCRQTYAFGMCIISVIMYIEDYHKRCIPIILIIAATIHLSALLFFGPFMLLIFLKRLRTLHFLSLLLAPLVLASPNTIISFMGTMVGKEQYARYGEQGVSGGTNTFVVLMILLSLYVFFAYKNYNFKTADKTTSVLYSMAPLFTFFAPLIISNGTMIRISMYFHIFLVLLVPYATTLLFGKTSKTINIALAVLLVCLALSSGQQDYNFFWEIDPVSTW